MVSVYSKSVNDQGFFDSSSPILEACSGESSDFFILGLIERVERRQQR